MERGRELLVEAGRKRSVSVRRGSGSLHVARWGFVLVWAAEPVLVGPGFYGLLSNIPLTWSSFHWLKTKNSKEYSNPHIYKSHKCKGTQS